MIPSFPECQILFSEIKRDYLQKSHFCLFYSELWAHYHRHFRFQVSGSEERGFNCKIGENFSLEFFLWISLGKTCSWAMCVSFECGQQEIDQRLRKSCLGRISNVLANFWWKQTEFAARDLISFQTAATLTKNKTRNALLRRVLKRIFMW